MELNTGDKAPTFSLPASNGEIVSLDDYNGKKDVILYFYPKDDTPGCTAQACGFRDKITAIESENAVVLGISPDNLTKHEKFIKKYDLPFVLLSDENKQVCQEYGVWVKKKMYGREYMGVERTTFIIGPDGTIRKIFRKVKPKTHNQEVLDSLISD